MVPCKPHPQLVKWCPLKNTDAQTQAQTQKTDAAQTQTDTQNPHKHNTHTNKHKHKRKHKDKHKQGRRQGQGQRRRQKQTRTMCAIRHFFATSCERDIHTECPGCCCKKRSFFSSEKLLALISVEGTIHRRMLSWPGLIVVENRWTPLKGLLHFRWACSFQFWKAP